MLVECNGTVRIYVLEFVLSRKRKRNNRKILVRIIPPVLFACTVVCKKGRSVKRVQLIRFKMETSEGGEKGDSVVVE